MDPLRALQNEMAALEDAENQFAAEEATAVPTEEAPDGEYVATDPATFLPGDKALRIDLSDEEEKELAFTIEEILEEYDLAMDQRYERWGEIDDAYNLKADPRRGGMSPMASKLTSEMTRSMVNLVTAWIVDSYLSANRRIEVQTLDDQARDDQTQEAVADAKAVEEFLEGLSDTHLRFGNFFLLWAQSAIKKGAALARLDWTEKTETSVYRKIDGSVGTTETTEPRLRARSYRAEDSVVWPLHETEIRESVVVGHRSRPTVSEFRLICRRLGVSEEEIRSLAQDGDEPDGPGVAAEERDLEGKQIKRPGDDPLKGREDLVELWCSLPLPGDDEPQRFVVFWHEQSRKLLYVGRNPLARRPHPYIDLQYWREEHVFWGSGVGHEIAGSQAADSAMWNLWIDSMKVGSANMIGVKAGSTAEAQRDLFGPGGRIVTEEQDDIWSVQLGAELRDVKDAIAKNEMRGFRATNLNAVIQGFADPTLKSGASPSMYAQMMEGSGKKFKIVDRGVRESISEFFFFALELIQQYCTDAGFEVLSAASDETRQRVRMLKFQPPTRDIRKTYRLVPRAPSATANRELQRQNLMVVFKLAVEFLQTAGALAQQLWGQSNPARVKVVLENLLEHHAAIYSTIVELMDIPGLSGRTPDFEARPEMEIVDEVMAGLMQRLQQLQSTVQQMGSMLQQQQGQPAAEGGNGRPQTPQPPGQPMGVVQ